MLVVSQESPSNVDQDIPHSFQVQALPLLKGYRQPLMPVEHDLPLTLGWLVGWLVGELVG